MEKKARSVMFSLVLTIVLLSSAYLAAGALNDQVVPEPELAKVTVEQVSTNGLGGTNEHPHLLRDVVIGTEYDLGVRMKGLEPAENVVMQLEISRSGITPLDVEAYYYDQVSGTWRALTFTDQGNTLVAVLGPVQGQDIDEGFDHLEMVIISFRTGGAISFKGTYETLD